MSKDYIVFRAIYLGNTFGNFIKNNIYTIVVTDKEDEVLVNPLNRFGIIDRLNYKYYSKTEQGEKCFLKDWNILK